MLHGPLLPILEVTDEQPAYDTNDSGVEDPPKATTFDVQLAHQHGTL